MPEFPEFEVPQFYETAIVMRGRGEELDREFQFLCAPMAAIHESNRQLLEDPQELLLTVLGMTDWRDLRVAQLPDAIFTLLTMEAQSEEASQDTSSILDLVSSSEWLDRRREVDPAAALFAEYLAFADVVPFEQSKMAASSITGLAMKSYSKASTITGLAPVPLVLGPHGAVVSMGVLGVGGVVAVVDSVGVVVGMAPKTASAVRAVRRGIGRLIRRPDHPAGQGETPEEPDDPAGEGETAEEREHRRTAEQRQIVDAMRKMLRELEKEIPLPGPAPMGDDPV
jgi:hypothetical protein